MQSNKYNEALNKHPFKLTNEQVEEKVSKILTEKAAQNNTKQHRQQRKCMEICGQCK